jgi:uncharacterized protein (TIGR00661 family)
MKILYGVQATGQGHISRARAMAAALRETQVEVTWLFSGRAREALYDMQPFGNYQHRIGLSFVTEAGRIRKRATLGRARVGRFLRDITSLELSQYDAVVTDFEPVTAWAARLAGVPAIGIGHQYAFGRDTPKAGHSWWAQAIMHSFAPVAVPLGLHWHPYADNVLPPVLDLPLLPRVEGGHILVYLPFEDQAAVTRVLQQLPAHRFVQYAPGLTGEQLGNVTRCRASIAGFKRHLAGSRAVLCNSGFELISECLHWGKPVLTKPLLGQMEQQSNAAALEQLRYATVCRQLDAQALETWLASAPRQPARPFADVATALAGWLADGAVEAPARLSQRLWGQTRPDNAALVQIPLTDMNLPRQGARAAA